MEIFFYGLICLIGSTRGGPKTYAVVVTSTVHSPYLYVDGNKTDLQAGDVITFTDDKGAAVIGDATPDSTPPDPSKFDNTVPHLQDLVTHGGAPGKIASGIADGTNPNSLALVRLPLGKLSVAEFYPIRGRFNPPGKKDKERCVARVVVLKPDPSVTIAGVSIKRKGTSLPTIMIKNWVLIENRPFAVGGAPVHFHEFLNITDGDIIGDIDPQSDNCTAQATSTKNLDAVEPYLLNLGSFLLAKQSRTARPNLRLNPYQATQVECAPSQFP